MLVKFTVIKLCVFDLLHLIAAWVISQITWQTKFLYLICCLPASILDFPWKHIIIQLTFSDWLSPPEACETRLLLMGWVFGDTQLSTASKCIKGFFFSLFFSRSSSIPTQDSLTVIILGMCLQLVWREKCRCQKKKKKASVSCSLASVKVFWEWKILNLSELTFFSFALFSPLSGRQLFSPWSGTSSTASPQICLWRLFPFLNGG